VEHAIAITRSQLRQVIEDYIAASRAGETLSYVETAKLSTADAAESSTARIWEGLERARRIGIELCGKVAMNVPAEQGEPDEDSDQWLIAGQIDDFMDGFGAPEDNRDIQAALQSLGMSTATAKKMMERLAKPAPTASETDTAAHEQAQQSQEFVCVEDLAAGQVVIVNSRGMIEGKRDEADNLLANNAPVVSYDFGFCQAEQLYVMFRSDKDAKVRLDFMPDGKVMAWDHSPDVAPVELIGEVSSFSLGLPEAPTETADDFF
jgi:hypothetical protein